MSRYTSSSIASLVLAASLFPAARASATPSSNVWAPSTFTAQPYKVLHVTYDTYFQANGAYPIDVGLTIGALPWQELQLEVGFDLLYPTIAVGPPPDSVAFPIVLNAKFAGAEDAYFKSSPGWSLGIYNLGFEKNVTDFDIFYGMIGKTLPHIGTFSIGGYYGLNDELLVDANGRSHQGGGLAGWFSQSIDVPYIDHINLSADVQTGKNVFGAAAAGLYLYFTPKIDLVMGPVFFFEGAVQPGGADWMWTMQLDVDIDFNPAPPSPPCPPPSGSAAPNT